MGVGLHPGLVCAGHCMRWSWTADRIWLRKACRSKQAELYTRGYNFTQQRNKILAAFGKTAVPACGETRTGGRKTRWLGMKGWNDLGEKFVRFKPSKRAKELKTMGWKNTYKERKLAVGTKWMWRVRKKEGTRTVLRFLSWNQVNCGTICRYKEQLDTLKWQMMDNCAQVKMFLYYF